MCECAGSVPASDFSLDKDYARLRVLDVKSQCPLERTFFFVECLIASEVGVLMLGVCIPDAQFRSVKTQENDLMT